ncbi:nicotinate-nucleotide--dimethylbenzimidazole phosphoribosyltransferase [Corynebacterium sp. HMSC072A04]|uniref:nicotinate-nucleotide--dimethylbenzimidazole phosphoribosyltransferase n=1 Tax=Corynebacterium sp. HMSC072A04 TaxID=1715045 RepID=UPI0008CF53B6|nr:nicotinate-nucleotide--dimethylbenzimidazole phosphoribosyltransferase [Corynebacterium sp. HMSC072A04]OFN33189.1 nicotinate-nucleotide--dimethylbenzimidazole phosphoribosyltransferase [Corynebacterium sp. HMSC072A04]
MPEFTAVPQLRPSSAAQPNRVAEIAAWLAAAQDSQQAKPLQRPRAIVFLSNPAIAVHTTDDGELTQHSPADEERWRDHLFSAAQRAGAGIDFVERTSAEPTSAEPGATSAAMTPAEFESFIDVGMATADREIDSGSDLLIASARGIDDATVAASLMGRITHTEPVAIVGTNTLASGITDAQWKTRVSIVRDCMFRARNLEGWEVVQTIGTPSVAALVGFIAQATARRTPVLIDGPLAATAAVLAERSAPGVKGWLRAGSTTPEPAYALALKELGIEPLLDLNLSEGFPLGALAALPLVQLAAELA